MTVQMDKEKLWQAALGELELNLSKANFTTWFRNTFIVDIRGDEAVVGVPNAFTKAWLENKYHKHILASLSHISNNGIIRAQYQVAQKSDQVVAPTLDQPETITKTPEPNEPTVRQTSQNDRSQTLNKYGLNPRYTFEGFIVGKANQLAHAAGLAVAKKPGEVYNPLFIYGGSGMGKTHLMQAIGHQILEESPQKNVIYVSCEKFTNEFINAISHGKADSFKNKYRSADVLLIDDVQFLANKEGTQEEFFHTFNALHQANKQIILSSDRPPKAIRNLEDRLVTRFEWGMLVDLPQPDLETRIAILGVKCRERKYPLSEEVVSYIARHVQNNIRELEGVLNRIIAYHNINNTPATLESVKQMLQTQQQHNTQKHRALTSKDVLGAVVSYFGISPANLTGSSRQKELVVPRQITMFLLREELRSSYPTIGQEMGGRDHTTAMHAYEKIKTAFEEDEKTRRDIMQIRQRLYE